MATSRPLPSTSPTSAAAVTQLVEILQTIDSLGSVMDSEIRSRRDAGDVLRLVMEETATFRAAVTGVRNQVQWGGADKSTGMPMAQEVVLDNDDEDEDDDGAPVEEVSAHPWRDIADRRYSANKYLVSRHSDGSVSIAHPFPAGRVTKIEPADGEQEPSRLQGGGGTGTQSIVRRLSCLDRWANTLPSSGG